MDDVFLPGVTDLFGDPVPKSRTKRGKPAHVPTAENRRFVTLALACGHDEVAIAEALRIHERTLKRHYFHELAGKRAARLRLDMKNLDAIVKQVEAGKPAAMAQLDKRIERMRQREVADKYTARAPSASAPALGKKEAAKRAAGEVTGKYAPRATPTLIH
ncbi:MAG: hypothetical protein OSB00_19740 [Sphingomonas bacterium]|nr:hypothetical protein [Sphingomonas bacterium]